MQLFGVNRIHKSRGILICKIFLLRKCQSGGGLGQITKYNDNDFLCFIVRSAAPLGSVLGLLRGDIQTIIFILKRPLHSCTAGSGIVDGWKI